jgi:ubiquinone/menaquinone biosynthesis C-methylase UbiE
LGVPDRSFDLVTAHTLVSHVDEPVRVLEEAMWVLRPGGTLVVFDGDYATLTFGTEDPEHGRAWDERIVRAIIANPRVMRRANARDQAPQGGAGAGASTYRNRR